MCTNSNYLGPFRNQTITLNLYRKLPLVNSLSLSQSETVFKINFEALHFELMTPKHIYTVELLSLELEGTVKICSSNRGPVILDRKKSCSDPGQFYYL